MEKEMFALKKIEVRAAKLSTYPIWEININGDYVDFYDRKTPTVDGLTKDEVLAKIKKKY